MVLSDMLCHVGLLFYSLYFPVVSFLTKMYIISIIRKCVVVKAEGSYGCGGMKGHGRVKSWVYQLVPLKCTALMANDSPTEGAVEHGPGKAKWTTTVKETTR